MSNLSVFTFEEQQVRFVGTAEQPEWVASDVGGVLGIKNVRQLLTTFEADEKGVCTIYTLGGSQEMLTVTEPGLYRLIFKSRKPVAKDFQRWVFHEVLPAIRKIGSYTLPSAEIELKKLDLQLIQAKHRYLETSHAIQLSTSPATLAWLRGETPPPPKVEYRERFVDPRTGKELGSAEGRSLTQLITDAGLNPKSTKHRQQVKRILKSCGFDYDKQQCWVTASYLNKYPVLEDKTYERVLRAVLAEIAAEGAEANLFVHHFEASVLTGQSQSQALQIE